MPFNGTGSNVTSLNASNISSGTVATARLGSGSPSSSNFLRGDGTWATPSSSGSTGIRAQVFSSSGTFTIPAGITSIKVTMVGGGGGGQGGFFQCGGPGPSQPGASGGGGVTWISGLTPGNTLTVTVGGGGGPGGTPQGTNGAGGGNSSISSGTQTITTVTGNGGSGSANPGGVGGTSNMTFAYATGNAQFFFSNLGILGVGAGSGGNPGSGFFGASAGSAGRVLIEW